MRDNWVFEENTWEGLNSEVILAAYIFLSSFKWMKWSESNSVMSDSLWPHGLYSPWNSPGQNTGMGSFSLLQGIFSTQGSIPGLLHCRQSLYQLSYQGSPEGHSVVSDSLRLHGLYSSWNSPGQNTGMGSFSLLPGIFPTQGSNPGLPHCRQVLYQAGVWQNPLYWIFLKF